MHKSVERPLERGKNFMGVVLRSHPMSVLIFFFCYIYFSLSLKTQNIFFYFFYFYGCPSDVPRSVHPHRLQTKQFGNNAHKIFILSRAGYILGAKKIGCMLTCNFFFFLLINNLTSSYLTSPYSRTEIPDEFLDRDPLTAPPFIFYFYFFFTLFLFILVLFVSHSRLFLSYLTPFGSNFFPFFGLLPRS